MAPLLKKIRGQRKCAVLLAAIIFAGCQSKELTTAKVHIQQNDWNKAVVRLEKAVAENPQNAEAQFLLGRGYALEGRFAEMNRAFEASLKASPQFALEVKSWQAQYFSEQFNRGVKAAGEKDWTAAREAFVLALQIDPVHPEAYRHLAYVHDKLGEPEKALHLYRTLIEIKPDDWDAYFAVAGIHQQRREYGKSEAVLEQALAKDPRQPRVLAELAFIYDCQGKNDEAFAAYRQALQIKPDDKELLLNWGRLHLAKEDYAGALQEFAKILTFDPDNFEATYHAGLCYLKLGERLQKQWREAKEQTAAPSASIKATPRPLPADSTQSAGLRLGALKNFKAAMPFLLKAAALDTLHAGAYFNLGFAYTKLGEAEKAKDAFKKCEELQEAKSDNPTKK
ncbi:MAG: tetratricopeptide repeat protein [bacterium]